MNLMYGNRKRHWNEECGVVGIAAVDSASELASLALHALQHRGQESAGITVADGHRLVTHKKMGLVADVFDEDVFNVLTPESALAAREAIGGPSPKNVRRQLRVWSNRLAL